ncbi:peptide ABC transporter permease [Frondihabitans sp. PAMC 28766]|nr:peptide ABC transporter permease [Frondihabitans sp. PAMC 28766]
MRLFGRALRRPSVTLSVLFVLFVLAWAVVPQAFAHSNPIHANILDRFQAPSAAHLFGTDDLGRDVWSRMIYGASSSLASSAFAVAIALVSGAALGLVAGFVRGVVDDVIMRIMDVVLAIPAIMLSLAIITSLGFGTVNVAVAVGFASTATFARVMRAEALTVSTSLYVEAARSSGVRWFTILRRHVLPGSLGPVLALAALEFGTAVLAISALSFLGFGAPPPTPEWGSIIADGRNYLSLAWWLTTLPGVVIVLLVIATNRISRAFEKEGARR